MKKVPQVLVDELSREMRKTKLSRKEQVEWFKWIRYYLDFCFKYQHSTRNPDTELLYLQKLSSKGQTHSQQAQASEAIALFRHAAKRFPATGQEQDQVQQPNDWGQVLIQLEQVLRVRQCAKSTSKNYRLWMLQFQEFLDSKPVAEVIDDDAAAFLTHLAVKKHVMASTQNQAFNALLFLFRHVLKRRFELRGRVQRARRTRYVPVVLSREEVDVIFSHMEDPHRLIAQLLYGCGLRLNETLNLRVEQVDLPQRRVTIHRGKGRKDRSLPLPLSIIKRLEQHLDQVKKQFDQDREDGFAGTFAPEGSSSYWNGRCLSWGMQFVFPAKTLTLVPATGEKKRYHVHGTHFSKSLRYACMKAGIAKRVGAHTLRHTFASHLLLANVDIRTIQDMLGHSNVQTTMIYTQTVPSRTFKDRQSPLDMDPELLKRKSA